jgi:hypothetical protein
MSVFTTLAIVTLVAGATLACADGGPAAQVVHAGNPCDHIINDPRPPGSEPEPEVGGTLIDNSQAQMLSGATVRLMVCVSGSGTLVDTAVTNTYGEFAFTDLHQGWYFVLPDMTGPLQGWHPVGSGAYGLVEVGNGDPDLEFVFDH